MGAADHEWLDGDDLVPTAIEHRCEAMVSDGQLGALYNYFVYHFECGGRYFWARSYLDDIGRVSAISCAFA
jgi:hypothetical protein